ncbi:MAG: hypothetical protein GX286_04050 [Clostridiales bacterium]|jgi:hypothetical protein|nr:hypothetical protein [Clostridiales bacterium]
MIQLIIGKKGTGKTKVLIEKINDAIKTTTGDLVCIEKGEKIRYDISYKVRLVDADRFGISGYETLYGFIAGMMAGNYDIKEIYVDSVLKIGGPDLNELGVTLDKLDVLTGDDTLLVFTVSADESELPDTVKKYL